MGCEHYHNESLKLFHTFMLSSRAAFRL